MTYFIEIMLNEETGAYHDALGASAEGYTPGCGWAWPYRRKRLETGPHLRARIEAHFRPEPTNYPADDQIEEDGAYHDALMRYRP
tara:strand:+ start:6533 stop:6787 length:255 start_codon:yes stop_codon:yes gene_type:complete